MINIRGIANNAIQNVNPNIPAILKKNTGYTIDEAGDQAPSFDNQEDVTVQNQPLSGKDLIMINTLNMSGGTFHAVHMDGNYEGIKRADGKGADILVFSQYEGAEPKEWLIVAVMESWPSWCRLILCRQ